MALLCAAPPVQAVPRKGLRFSEARSLPALGMQLRIMPGARECPLPIPHVYPYHVTTSTGEFRTVMYDPRELWMASQHAAEWDDADGNRLTMARIESTQPGPFSRIHVLREDYDAALPAAIPAAGWTLPALARWMDDFSGVTGASARQLTPPTPRFTRLVEFVFPPTASNLMAYAFQINPRALGQSRAPTNWNCALFRFGPNTDPKRARLAVETRFLYYVSGTADGGTEPSASVNFQDPARAPGTNASAAFLDSKAKVVASIGNLHDWWYAATDNYILLSNLASSDRRTIRQLQADIEVLRGVYARLIPPRVPIRAVSVIRMPATEAEYKQYVGPRFEWTGGMWMPARAELIIRAMDDQDGRERHQNLLQAGYHEAFHQYLYYAYEQVESSPWYNEGHAAMFENVNIQNRGVQVLESKEMAALLEDLLRRKAVNIDDVLRLNLDAFYAPDPQVRRANYTVAWALVYYLRHGVATDRKSPYVGLLERYADLLWQLRDATKATEQTFAGLDLDELAKDFRFFWFSTQRRAQAERIWLERGE